jgi:hypothetical protein
MLEQSQSLPCENLTIKPTTDRYNPGDLPKIN